MAYQDKPSASNKIQQSGSQVSLFTQLAQWSTKQSAQASSYASKLVIKGMEQIAAATLRATKWGVQKAASSSLTMSKVVLRETVKNGQKAASSVFKQADKEIRNLATALGKWMKQSFSKVQEELPQRTKVTNQTAKRGKNQNNETITQQLLKSKSSNGIKKQPVKRKPAEAIKSNNYKSSKNSQSFLTTAARTQQKLSSKDLETQLNSIQVPRTKLG